MDTIWKDKVKKKQIISAYELLGFRGMLALAIGSLMPYIRDERGLSYAFCGLLVSLHSVGNLISSFASGVLPEYIGRRKSNILFSICYPVSFIMILLFKDRTILMMAFFLTGLTRGAGSNFCNKIINDIAPGKASMLNGLHAMFSIGAFLYPILLMLITVNADKNWIYGCILLIAMGLCDVITFANVPLMDEKKAKGSDRKSADKFGFFREPMYYLCFLALFFYLCAEQGVMGWLVTYFKDTGLLSGSMAQSTASVQWAMMLIGRLSVAYLSTKIDKKKMLPIMGIGMAVFFILLVRSTTPLMIMIGLMGFGLFMAGIYPTTVTFSADIIKRYSLSWSFLLTSASFGSIIMPSIIGWLAEGHGMVMGMTSVVVAVVIDMICIFALIIYSKKKAN